MILPVDPWALSSAGLEHLPYKQGVRGSNPLVPTIMKKITNVSAPGKLILFGEHAVVYGQPCIVTAVSARLSAKVSLLKDPHFTLDAPDVDIRNYIKPLDQLGHGTIPKGVRFAEIAAKNFFAHFSEKFQKRNKQSPQWSNRGIHITTTSEFPSTYGLGSSSASVVCTLKALSEITTTPLSNTLLFDLAYKTILDIQGKGSGFDVAAAIYGGTMYFKKGGATIKPIAIEPLPIVVGYTGLKADTTTIMHHVTKKAEQDPAFSKSVDSLYISIGRIVEQAQIACDSSDWSVLGRLMNENQEMLEQLGVSSNKLDLLIRAARTAGALGAKLSGAGGGDSMIALVSSDTKKAVEEAISNVDGKVLDISTHAHGVTRENQT